MATKNWVLEFKTHDGTITHRYVRQSKDAVIKEAAELNNSDMFKNNGKWLYRPICS